MTVKCRLRLTVLLLFISAASSLRAAGEGPPLANEAYRQTTTPPIEVEPLRNTSIADATSLSGPSWIGRTERPARRLPKRAEEFMAKLAAEQSPGGSASPEWDEIHYVLGPDSYQWSRADFCVGGGDVQTYIYWLDIFPDYDQSVAVTAYDIMTTTSGVHEVIIAAYDQENPNPLYEVSSGGTRTNIRLSFSPVGDFCWTVCIWTGTSLNVNDKFAVSMTHGRLDYDLSPSLLLSDPNPKPYEPAWVDLVVTNVGSDYLPRYGRYPVDPLQYGKVYAYIYDNGNDPCYYQYSNPVVQDCWQPSKWSPLLAGESYTVRLDLGSLEPGEAVDVSAMIDEPNNILEQVRANNWHWPVTVSADHIVEGSVVYADWEADFELRPVPFCQVEIYTDGSSTPDTTVVADASGAYRAYIRGDRQTVYAQVDLSSGDGPVAAWDYSDNSVAAPLVDRSPVRTVADLDGGSLIITGLDDFPDASSDELFTAGANAVTAFYQHRSFMQTNWNSGWEFQGTQHFLIDPNYNKASVVTGTQTIHVKSWFGDPAPLDNDIRFLQHELAHVVVMQSQPQIPTCGGLHYICQVYLADYCTAFWEGWADAVCAMIPDQNPDKFFEYNPGEGCNGNIETNDWADTSGVGAGDGMFIEGRIALLIYDLLDSYPGDDDPWSMLFSEAFAPFADRPLPDNYNLSIQWYLNDLARLDLLPPEERQSFCLLLDELEIPRDWPEIDHDCDPNEVEWDETNPLELLPACFEVSQNYPNPFNGSTTVSVDIPRVGDLKIFVYNVLGQVVAATNRPGISPGQYRFCLDLSEQASGVYLVRAGFDEETRTIKTLYLK